MRLDRAEPHAELAWYAKGLMLARSPHENEMAAMWATQHGAERAGRLLKAIPAATLNDPAWAGALATDLNVITGAFTSSLRTTSVFYRILADGSFARVPMGLRAGVISIDVSGSAVSEGAPIPIGRMTLEALALQPKKAAAMVILTRELAAATGSAAEALFGRALRLATSAAVDGVFVDSITDTGVAAVPSSGSTPVQIRADLGDMLTVVDTRSDAKLYWLAPTEVTKALAAMSDAVGQAAFSSVAPTGMSELLNLPLLTSDALGPDEMLLIAANAIAADTGTPPLELAASSTADIEMLSSSLQQDATVGTGAQLVSMFQTNSVALRVIAELAVEVLRPGSTVARLTGINWAGTA